jgi:hypothetical protein
METLGPGCGMYADEQPRVKERSAARRTAGLRRIDMTQGEDTMFLERCQLAGGRSELVRGEDAFSP